MVETVKLGSRGTLVIPARLRKALGIDDGALLILEQTAQGFTVRPAVAMPVEIYTPERKAEFLLSNSVDATDYATARKLVKELGLDPDAIPHERPPDVKAPGARN